MEYKLPVAVPSSCMMIQIFKKLTGTISDNIINALDLALLFFIKVLEFKVKSSVFHLSMHIITKTVSLLLIIYGVGSNPCENS